MSRRLLVLATLLALAVLLSRTSRADGGGTPGTSSNFTLVGHNDLLARGMNAAPALFCHYLYIGNRTDGSDTCENGTTGCPHSHPGVLIV